MVEDLEKEDLQKYEKQLMRYTQALQECQANKQLRSCLKCEDVIGCKVRDDYVKAVYQSMNKGESGGFEF